jgi:hypothetical protein
MIVDLHRRWLSRAKCAGMGTDAFFTDHSPAALVTPTAKLQAEWNKAKAICEDCPVWKECARDCLGEQDGVWGGLDPAQRYKIRHKHGHRVRALSGPLKVEYAKLAYDLKAEEYPWYEIARIMGLSQEVATYLVRWYEDYLKTGDDSARELIERESAPGRRTITEEEIHQILELREQKLRYADIAKRVGFSEYTVRKYCLEAKHAAKDTGDELLQAG